MAFSSLFWKKYASKNDQKKQQQNNCTMLFLKPVFFYIRYKKLNTSFSDPSFREKEMAWFVTYRWSVLKKRF